MLSKWSFAIAGATLLASSASAQVEQPNFDLRALYELGEQCSDISDKLEQLPPPEINLSNLFNEAYYSGNYPFVVTIEQLTSNQERINNATDYRKGERDEELIDYVVLLTMLYKDSYPNAEEDRIKQFQAMLISDLRSTYANKELYDNIPVVIPHKYVLEYSTSLPPEEGSEQIYSYRMKGVFTSEGNWTCMDFTPEIRTRIQQQEEDHNKNELGVLNSENFYAKHPPQSLIPYLLWEYLGDKDFAIYYQVNILKKKD